MARKREVERAKKRFLAVTEHHDWVQGVGIGHVESQLGLVINVRPRMKPAANRLLSKLKLNVPVMVRVVDEVRARTPSRSSSESESIESLRNAARSRILDAKRLKSSSHGQ